MYSRTLDEAIESTEFNNIRDMINLLKEFDLGLDKAVDNIEATNAISKIMVAYVEHCSNPRMNIQQLTMLLGEEDLNLRLLEPIEQAIRLRETQEKIRLPSLSQSINEARAATQHVSTGQMLQGLQAQKSVLETGKVPDPLEGVSKARVTRAIPSNLEKQQQQMLEKRKMLEQRRQAKQQATKVEAPQKSIKGKI